MVFGPDWSALAYAATTILIVNAYIATTAANAILLQFTAPIYVVFLAAWLLKEKTKMYDWLTVNGYYRNLWYVIVFY